jgi:branched-chain amino acid aminotransferase
MLNADGYVAECTGDNVFIVKGKQIFTPPLYAGALYGITRGVAIDVCEQAGWEVTETNLTRYDLYNADECFLTGTGAEIIPVVNIDGRKIGTGKPGKLSKQLMKEYHTLTNSTGEPI